MSNEGSPPKREALGRRRPIILTLLCMMGFIGFPFTVMQLTDPSIKKEIIEAAGEKTYRLDILSSILFLVGYAGIWLMKRWGLVVLAAITVYVIWYYLTLNMTFIFMRSALNIIILLMGALHIKEMD